MHFVYVIYSTKHDKIYIGYTQNLDKRKRAHNHPDHKGWTTKYQPWKLAYYETFRNQSETLKREKALKSHQGRKWIWRLIQENER